MMAASWSDADPIINGHLVYCPQMQAHLNPGTFVLVEMEAIEEQDGPFVEVCCIVAATDIPTYSRTYTV